MRYMKIKQTLWFIAVFVDDSVHYFLLEFRMIKQYNDPKLPRCFHIEAYCLSFKFTNIRKLF